MPNLARAHTPPEAVEFERWDNFLREQPAAVLVTSIRDDMPFDDAIARFRELFVESANLMREHHQRSHEFEVSKWLLNEKAYERALAMLLRGRKSQSDPIGPVPAGPAERAISRAMRRAEATLDVKAGIRSLQASFSGNWVAHSWRAKVIRALGDYLYSNTPEIQWRLRHEALPLLSRLEKLAAQLSPLLAMVDDANRPAVQGAMTLRRGLDAIPRVQRSIENFTVERNSERARERLFVDAMYRANVGFRGSVAKPEVIAELMTIPIFNSPYDVRHIARLCKEFREADAVKRNASHTT